MANPGWGWLPAMAYAPLSGMVAAEEIELVLKAKAQALIARQAEELDDLIHPDFVYVNAGGRTFDKARYIETYCTSGRVVFTQQQFDDLSVKLIDAFAIATLLINDELRIDERTVSSRYRSLCVFNRSSGRWLWVAGQTMAVGVA